MPQAALVAGITGAAQLGGALIGNRANSNALNAQRRANDQAMRLQTQRDADARARYDRDYAAYQQRQSQRNELLRAVLGRYGVTFGAPAAAPGAAAAPAESGLRSAQPGGSPVAPMTAGSWGGAPMAPLAAPGSQFAVSGPSGTRQSRGFSLGDLMSYRR